MAFHTILFSIGFLLIALAGAMIPPAILDFIYKDINWLAFAKACPLTGMIGFMLFFAYRPAGKPDLSLKDTFLLTVLSWIAVAFFAALPFIFSDSSVTLTNSFFETISGLTTTGATVMQGIDYASRGILLWRSLLQWLGGVGILVMALVIWPVLRVGGMQLFRNDFSDRSEKIYPKISQIANSILTVYTALTALCSLLLWIAGMPAFEALCHGLSTFSTGGFSTSSRPANLFDNVFIDIILMVFMVLGAMTLTLFVLVLKGDIKTLYKDVQVRVFLSIITISSLIITFWLFYSGTPFLKAFHHASFQVISIITTTGHTLPFPLLWGPLPSIIFLILMQIGGCTGSTSGSVKIFRYIILFSVAKAQIAQLRRPHGIFIARYQGKQIPEGIFLSVFTYLALYILSLAIVVIGLALCDLDLISCLSGATMALSNTGIGLGPVIGPEGSFNHISDGAKWILMFAMFIGRLEYVTLFILLSRSFWRD
jgi:trk system potassium uptake protein TrkH